MLLLLRDSSCYSTFVKCYLLLCYFRYVILLVILLLSAIYCYVTFVKCYLLLCYFCYVIPRVILLLLSAVPGWATFVT